MRVVVRQFILTFCALMFSTSGWSQSPSHCKRIFRVGALNNEPIFFRNEKGAIDGVLFGLLKELKERTGCQFEPFESSRPMLVSNIRSSALDFTALTIKTPSLDKVANFIPMYLGRRAIILIPSLKGKKLTLDDIMKDKKIIFGSLIGTSAYYTPKEIEFLRKNKRLTEFPDYVALFAALSAGKIQASIGSYVVGSYFVNKLKLTDYSFELDLTKSNYVGSYYNPQRLGAEEVRLFSKIFDDIVKDGTMAKIYEQYIPKAYVEKSFVPRDTKNP